MTRTPFSILIAAVERGQRLEVHGDKLCVIPGRDLPPDFVAELQACKWEVIALLEGRLKERTTDLYSAEVDWLNRWCKLGDDPDIVLAAARMFNARIARIEPSNKFVPYVHKDATEGG